MDNRKWLEERFLNPVVICAASPDCEEVCKKNGVSFYQLLKPFQRCGSVIHTSTGKDVSHQQSIKDFGIRFFRPDGLREMDPRTRVEHFQSLMRESGRVEVANGAQLNSVLEKLLAQPDLLNPKIDSRSGKVIVERTFASWHDAFIRDYVHGVRCSYFDTVDHPVGFFFGISSAGGADAVMRRVNELAATRERFFQGMNIPAMDTDTHIFYMLVHDNSENACNPMEFQAAVDTMAKALGPSNCAVVRINSNREATPRVSPQPWVEANRLVDCYATEPPKLDRRLIYELPNAASGKVASHLTEADILELQSALTKYMSSSLVPWIANKLIKLMDMVEKKRTTTFSKMAAWFKSDQDKDKAKTEVTFVSVGDGGPKRYLAAAVEVQMRRCGDLFMNLRDFENSLKYLRLARDELRNTLVARPFNNHLIAASQEAVGICFYFQGRLPLPGGPRGDECRLDEAKTNYITAGVHSYAFRAALILVALCRNRVQPENSRALVLTLSALRAGNLYSNRTYAAVLHELCANYVLVSNPPMAGNSPDMAVSVPDKFPFICNIRKHSRYMALAGAAYLDIEMYDQALKCYLRALTIQARLGGTTWQSLMEHVILSLATIYSRTNQQARGLGMLCVAARDGMPSFVGAHSRVQIEALLSQVRSFLMSSNLTFVPHMMIPRARVSKVAVVVNSFSEDDLTAEESSLVEGEALDSEWREMEDSLRNFLAACKSPVSLPIKKKKDGGGKARVVESYHTLVGELATVRIPFTNNTGAALSIDNVALIFRRHQSPSGAAAAPPASTPPLQFCSPLPSALIPAESTTVLQLPFVSREAGIFDVVGVTWQLLGVESRMYFANAISDELGVCKVVEQVEVFERTVTHPEPPLAAPQHIKIVVDGSAAGVRMTFDPPLPQRVRDGFVYRGRLVLTNSSASCIARSLAISRSQNNAHLLYFNDFSLKENEDFDVPLSLGERSIAPKASIFLSVTFRAQHDASSRASAAAAAAAATSLAANGAAVVCNNYIPLLLSYASEHKGEIVPTGAASIRLHKMLRRVMVAPSVSVATTLLPPPPSMSDQQDGHASAKLVALVQISNTSTKLDAPIRVGRVIATSSSWRMAPLAAESLTGETTGRCFLMHRQRLAMPLTIERRNVGASAGAAAASNAPQDDLLLDSAATLRGAPDEAAALRETVGAAVADSEEMTFFVKHALKAGSGKIGVEEEAGGQWAFFMDGAGGRPMGGANFASGGGEGGDSLAATVNGATVVAKKVAPHTPVLLTVTWTANENGATHTGQIFTFVDPLLTQRHAAVADWVPKTVPESAIKNPTHTLNAFVDAFAKNEAVVPRRGLVTYCASYPARVDFPASELRIKPQSATAGSGSMPGLISHAAALAAIAETVTVRVAVTITSMAPQPLSIDVVARNVASNVFNAQLPFAYVGRTRAKFVLQPDETRTLEFAAALPGPGSYNLNTLEVNATSLKSVPAAGSGQVPKPLLERVTVLGSGAPWRCCAAEDTRAPIGGLVGASSTSSHVATPTGTGGGVLPSAGRIRSRTTVYATPTPVSLPPSRGGGGGGGTAGRHRTMSMAKEMRPTVARRPHSMSGVFAAPPQLAPQAALQSSGAAGDAAAATKAPSNSLLATLEAFQRLQQQRQQQPGGTGDSPSLGAAAGDVQLVDPMREAPSDEQPHQGTLDVPQGFVSAPLIDDANESSGRGDGADAAGELLGGSGGGGDETRSHSSDSPAQEQSLQSSGRNSPQTFEAAAAEAPTAAVVSEDVPVVASASPPEISPLRDESPPVAPEAPSDVAGVADAQPAEQQEPPRKATGVFSSDLDTSDDEEPQQQ